MSLGERSKGDFLERLIPAARRLYGIELSEAKFESWIDEDVVSARKTDCYAYRRALEACRIESRAPPGRRLFVREIRIHLYLGGRDFQGSVIREDLREEFARSKRELFRSVRNMQSTIDGPQLSENQLSRLVSHLGEPAPEIHPPDFRYQNHELASLISLARTGDNAPRQLGAGKTTSDEVITAVLVRFGLSSFINFLDPDFVALIVMSLAGALGEATEIAEQAGELVFESATDAEFDVARAVLRIIPWITEQLPLMAAVITPGDQEILSGLVNPCHRIGQVIRTQPQFRLAAFAILLTAIHRNPGFLAQEKSLSDIIPMLRDLIIKIRADPILLTQLNTGNPWQFLELLFMHRGEMTISRIRLLRLVAELRRANKWRHEPTFNEIASAQ